jgi:hypothetical protein
MKQSAFLFAFLCSASAAAETQYVVASVANLRGSPQAEGALVARLPISMPVEISKAQGDWSAVTVQKKNGWVLSSLLSRERPSFTMMLALYDATPRSDIATRRKWVERATALRPRHLGARARLVEVLKETDDDKALAQVMRSIAFRFRTNMSGPLDETARPSAFAKLAERFLGMPDRGLAGYGVRGMWEAVASSITWTSVMQAAGDGLFTNSVHYHDGPALEAKSSFSHYDPVAVQRIVDEGIPGAENPRVLRALQPAYDSKLQGNARNYLRAILTLEADAKLTERLLGRYRSYLEKPWSRGPPHRGSISSSDGNYVDLDGRAISFWLRRMMDGSAGRFHAGLEKLMLLYDPAGYLTAYNERKHVVAKLKRAALGQRAPQIVVPGDFHGREVNLPEKSAGVALVLSPSPRLVAVNVDVVSVADQLTGDPNDLSGWRVTAGVREPVILITGTKLKAGPVKALTLEDHCLTKSGCVLRLAGKKTRIHSLMTLSGDFEMPRTGRLRHKLLIRRGTLAQPIERAGTIVFAGDIDGDGKIDLLLDHTGHYNVRRDLALYLSSLAPAGAVFGLPLTFYAVGC